jgi:hypothetical protein
MAAALEDDVSHTVERVRRASARVVGELSDVEIDLRVDVGEGTDLAVVRRQIEEEVLPRFARAAGFERSTTYLDLRLEPATRHVA